jgi:hypothetical protein
MPNEHRLPDNFVLEVLGTLRIGTRLHRICRLVEIRGSPSSEAADLPSSVPAETATLPIPVHS